MNTQANKEVENRNAQGQLEKKVETVDYRKSAGQEQEQRTRVQVVHQPHSAAGDFTTSGGVLASAAAAVANTLQSAKDAISRK